MSPRKKSARKGIPGSVFKRGNKWAYSFYGRPHPLTGKREKVRKSGFDTEEAAWDAMFDARAELAAETYLKPSHRTVAEFFEEWFPYVRTTTEPTTAANYEALARAYVLPWIGKRQLQDIVPSVIAALYDQLLRAGRRKRDTNWEMYQRWEVAHRTGQEICPSHLVKAVGVSVSAARRAVRRYEAGRIPKSPEPGLAPKTVQSVDIMLGAAMTTAVKWKYLRTNPTAGVKPPSVVRKPHRTWTPEQMTRYLEAAREERLYGLWALVATTGMRRSELCGLRWEALDLTAATVQVNSTRVVAAGSVKTGAGKSDRSRRLLALDVFTVAVLREHLDRLDEEREAGVRTTRTTGSCSAGRTGGRSIRTPSPPSSTGW